MPLPVVRATALLLSLAFVACGAAVEGSEREGSSAPAHVIAEGAFHLGEDGGVEPTINVELSSDGTFRWQTDPGRYGDWIPGGSGVWTQADGMIKLRPKAPELSMSFAPILNAALNPTSFVVEANLRVAPRGGLVTSSLTKESGETWTPASHLETEEITWQEGRACTLYGRSNGCITR